MVPVIVVLLITGCILILASFIFKDAVSGQSGKTAWTEDEIANLVECRFSEAKYRLTDEAERSADQIKDQTERELEKLSNEKIMAVNEYSDQVMDQINKNHNEVMFLYSMLSDKQKELDYAVEKINRMKQRTEDEEKLAKNAEKQKTEADSDVKKPEEIEQTEDQRVRITNGQAKELKRVPPKEKQDEKYANKRRILEMHEEGMPSEEIAKQLNLGIGEVRLVLELSKGRKNG